jgi:uncharacterized membrane protein
MEILTFFLLLITFIILLINNSSVKAQLREISKELERLRNSIAKIEFQEKPFQKAEKPSPVQETFEPVKAKDEQKEAKPIVKTVDPMPEKPVSPKTEIPAGSYDDTVKAKLQAMKETEVSFTTSKPKVKQPKPPTDFEKFIGENLISKIGILILVMGVAFFVKFAIDNDWIGVIGRTAIGLLTGGILIGVAHFMRKSYRTFSSLLAGGGLAIFYLTIGIAFHIYHIFNQEAAFAMMVVITLFSVVLSLLYDKKELAIFSQIGGYAAPFMVATGEGNYMALFTYMLILNAGLLVLAYFKRWHILNLLAFIFTVIIFSGWLGSTYWNNSLLPHRNALMFAIAFYIVFFLANILNNLKERTPFKSVEITMILSNNLFFFISGLTILYTYQGGMYKGLFTVLTAIFNFAWVVYLYKKKQVDRNLVYLLVALVMSYISLAIPIQLNGHSITLFWTAELVILLWLSQVSGIKILKTGHLLVFALVIISLVMDWRNLYFLNRINRVILNQAFITGMVVLVGTITTAFLLAREKEETFVKNIITTKAYKSFVGAGVFAIAFMVPFLEIIYQVQIFYPVNSFVVLMGCLYVYAYLFIALLITCSEKFRSGFQFLFMISWVALFLYFIVFSINLSYVSYIYMTGKTLTTGNFIFHFLAIPFIAGMLYLMNRKIKLALENQTFISLFQWFTVILLVFMASLELDNIVILVTGAKLDNYYTTLEMVHKAGYPILWGLCAFVLIIFGIRSKKKFLRVQALFLFGLIILKLFLFDVWSMSKGGRIGAFIFLGIVLLVVSFLYQKLNNLLRDNKKDETITNQES